LSFLVDPFGICETRVPVGPVNDCGGEMLFELGFCLLRPVGVFGREARKIVKVLRTCVFPPVMLRSWMGLAVLVGDF